MVPRRGIAGIALLLVAAAPAPSLLSPIERACISSPFGVRGGQMHHGIDLPAPAGAWVRAAAPGRVEAVRRHGASGLHLQLRHADGSFTRYAHLGTVTPDIASGRRIVALGDRLGRVGRTGSTRGTHLHFELHVGGLAVDPAPSVGLRACVALATA